MNTHVYLYIWTLSAAMSAPQTDEYVCLCTHKITWLQHKHTGMHIYIYAHKHCTQASICTHMDTALYWDPPAEA